MAHRRSAASPRACHALSLRITIFAVMSVSATVCIQKRTVAIARRCVILQYGKKQFLVSLQIHGLESRRHRRCTPVSREYSLTAAWHIWHALSLNNMFCCDTLGGGDDEVIETIGKSGEVEIGVESGERTIVEMTAPNVV